jgi:serine/threonine protein phosphatase 1
MFGMFSRQPSTSRGPSGHRAYVVGDVHGRLDLLEELLAAIERDVRASPPEKALLVFLGDLIDRGPNSASVVELLRLYSYPPLQTVFLLGNHEEVLLRIRGGESPLIADWRLFGGAETVMSYGVEPEALAGLDKASMLAVISKASPQQHVAFLRGFADTCRFGDYLFVHAGIRPGIELEQQKQADLRWIREPFLTDSGNHGFVVVHGHTISNEVEERPNRIGIDTGAYKTGVLTALVIDDDRRSFLTTDGNEESDAPSAH